MPNAEDFQRLADELRKIEGAIIQAAGQGDQELVLLAVGALSSAANRSAWWAREAAENEAASVAADVIEKVQRAG